MIRLEAANAGAPRKAFDRLYAEVYRAWPQHRATEEDVAHLVLGEKTLFRKHATIEPYLALDGDRAVARFALIQDRRRPEYAQVAFFESLPGVEPIVELARARARERFPDAKTLVAGVNGHLNYSAGFLASAFDQPPMFGLPWTPEYYLQLFPGLKRRDMFSFRFKTAAFHASLSRPVDFGPVKVRTMDRRQLARDVALYTQLNNACFQQHPYWVDRTADEDLELLEPFTHFIDDGHLLFAEVDGQAVGFLLWYPDFNELAAHGERLGLKHLLKYKLLGRRPKAFRLTEIAVVEPRRNKGVVPALMHRLTELSAARGHEELEGGFIFEDNAECVQMTLHSMARILGEAPGPHRRYCVFEGPL